MTISRTTARLLLFPAIVLAVLLAAQTAAFGQAAPAVSTADPEPSPSPSPTASPSLESQFFKNILHDQRAIWLGPFGLKKHDARWLGPLGLSTAILIATDRRTSAELIEHGDNQTRLRVSADVSRLGELTTTGGAAAVFYFVGRATHNARARETGLLAAEALVDSGIVSSVLKLATQRTRPNIDNGRGEFREDGDSFPSGHATSAWTLAAVVAGEYHDRPLIKWGAYGVAAAVSLSRYTGRNHFLSDVLVGSAIGYGIGRYVYHQHHDRSIDGNDGADYTKRSKLIPLIQPHYSRVSRTYAATLTWNF
jgi:membrane-associated phospholipid phosphatase